MDQAEKNRSRHLILGYVADGTDEQVAEIIESMEARNVTFGAKGDTGTSVWHEVTLYARAHDTRRRCVHCGQRGRNLTEATPAHELCRLRAERGLPTIPLAPSDEIECPCFECCRPVTEDNAWDWAWQGIR